MFVPRFTSGGDMGTPGWRSNCVIVSNKKKRCKKNAFKKALFFESSSSIITDSSLTRRHLLLETLTQVVEDRSKAALVK